MDTADEPRAADPTGSGSPATDPIATDLIGPDLIGPDPIGPGSIVACPTGTSPDRTTSTAGGAPDDIGCLTQLAVTDHAAAAAAVAAAGARLLGGSCLVILLGPDRRLARVAAMAAEQGGSTARRPETLVGTVLEVAASSLLSTALRTDRTMLGAGDLATLVTPGPAAIDPPVVDPSAIDPPAIDPTVAGAPATGSPVDDPAGVGPPPAPGPRAGSVLVVPIRPNDLVVGALCALAGASHPGFDPSRQQALQTLAGRSGPAMEIVRARVEHERQAERARILVGWSHATSLPDGPSGSALEEAVRAASAAVGGRCRVIQDPGGMVPSRPRSGGEEPADRPGTVRLPLSTPDRGFGWLAAHRHAPFDQDDLRFLRTLARQIALAWEGRQVSRERDAALTALRLSEERFRLAFDEAPVGMALIRLSGSQPGSIILANRALAELTRISQEVLLDMRYDDLVHPDDLDVDRVRFAEMLRGERVSDDREKRVRRPDGGVAWVRATLAAIHRNGRPWYAVLHIQDVTARRTALAQLEHQALHDSLTGLGNRNRLLDHLRLELARLDRAPAVVAALFLDLDRFKSVNDTRGHSAGDAVLREVADRIATTVRAPDTVARISGDEFVIAATLHDESDAVLLAERVQQSLQPPIELDGDQVVMTASLGIATSRTSDTDPADLLRRADLAMYHAKYDARRDAGPAGVRRWQMYHEALGDRARHRDEVLRMLQAAPEAGWLRLVFQPIVALATGRVVAAEALLRLEHPRRGLLQPAAFIDVAEAHDVILPIGQWVLTEAIRQLREWHRLYGIEIGVNVSGRQVARRVVGAQVQAATAAAGYTHPADLVGLRLEVTERVALEADDDVVADLRKLSDQGVRLALDDFGTGYASLLHVRRLPVDELKIDHSFVAGLGIDPDDTAIVRAVTALAGSLGLGTVAEGVQRPEQLPLLRDLGCLRAQGYLLGVPMTPTDLTRLLESEPPPNSV